MILERVIGLLGFAEAQRLWKVVSFDMWRKPKELRAGWCERLADTSQYLINVITSTVPTCQSIGNCVALLFVSLSSDIISLRT